MNRITNIFKGKIPSLTIPVSYGDGFLVFVIVCAVAFLTYLVFAPRYPDVPTLRLSTRPGWLGVIADCRLFMTDVTKLINAGWTRYSKQGVNYLLNTPSGKLFIVAPRFLEEVRRAPDDYVSTAAANARLLQLRHTIHEDLVTDQYHIDAPLRKSLTQSIDRKLPEIVEEAKIGLNGMVSNVKGVPTQQISLNFAFSAVTQPANRILFGTELARNEEFHIFSIGYAKVLFQAANLLRNFPEFLKPTILWWKTDIYSSLAAARSFLVPVLRKRIADEDRYAYEGKLEEWQKLKPDDMVQWVIDETPPHKRDPDILTYRMLHVNIAAIHTTSTTFLETLLCLAVQPQYHEELRAEIVNVFRQEGGWTKQGLTRLIKLDSFMSEVQRLCVLTSLNMGRVILKDWHLSDGTRVPKGTFMFMNHSAMVIDADYFEEPHKFDPWRMYWLRQEPGQADLHQFVSTSERKLAFGHGRHACPGRHFAACELKTLLVLVLMRYEITATNPTGVPLTVEEVIRGVWYNKMRMPLMSAMLQFTDRGDKIPSDLQAMF